MVPILTVNGFGIVAIVKAEASGFALHFANAFGSALPQCGQTGPFGQSCLDIREGGGFVVRNRGS